MTKASHQNMSLATLRAFKRHRKGQPVGEDQKKMGENLLNQTETEKPIKLLTPPPPKKYYFRKIYIVQFKYLSEYKNK